MKNKKASADTWVVVSKWSYYIIVIFIASIAIILFSGKSYSFLDSKASTPVYLEEDILIAQLVNTCFSYEEQDGLLEGRVYQNVLDVRKLSNTRLDSCILGSAIVTVTSLTDEFEPYSLRAGQTTVKTSFSQFVLVRIGDELYPARLTVVL